jgi:hypothetical protein
MRSFCARVCEDAYVNMGRFVIGVALSELPSKAREPRVLCIHSSLDTAAGTSLLKLWLFTGALVFFLKHWDSGIPSHR